MPVRKDRKGNVAPGKLRSWFSDLSGPKKVLAGVLALATAVGTIVGAVSGSIALYEELAGPSSKVEFIDVGFISSTTSPSPQLDIKLKNSGEGTAFVKQATFRVQEIRTLTPPYHCPDCVSEYAAPSFQYEVRLPASGTPYTRSLDLSQEIAPNDTDRFLIDLIVENRQPNEDYVFIGALFLVVDDDKRLSRNIIFAPPVSAEPAYTGAGEDWILREGLEDSDASRLNAQNKETIEAIKETKAVRNDNVTKLVQIFS